MKAIFEPVYNTAGVEQLNKELAKDGGRTVMVSGCIDTQKLHFSSAIWNGEINRGSFRWTAYNSDNH